VLERQALSTHLTLVETVIAHFDGVEAEPPLAHLLVVKDAHAVARRVDVAVHGQKLGVPVAQPGHLEQEGERGESNCRGNWARPSLTREAGRPAAHTLRRIRASTNCGSVLINGRVAGRLLAEGVPGREVLGLSTGYCLLPFLRARPDDSERGLKTMSRRVEPSNFDGVVSLAGCPPWWTHFPNSPS